MLEGGEGGLGGVVVAKDAEARGPGRRGESVAQAEPFAGLAARVAGDHGVRDGRQDFRLGAFGPLVVSGPAGLGDVDGRGLGDAGLGGDREEAAGNASRPRWRNAWRARSAAGT